MRNGTQPGAAVHRLPEVVQLITQLRLRVCNAMRTFSDAPSGQHSAQKAR
ncbi:MAG: hypothetical protein LC749_11670 [Actinobacteria bacterium]|nr:hypothetical protein [Actinomycetota bacterium]